MPQLRFLFVLRSVNSFAMSVVESLSVLSVCIFKIVRLLKRSWFIFKQSHVFSLRAVEKDLSPAALVARAVTEVFQKTGTSRLRCHHRQTSCPRNRSTNRAAVVTERRKQQNSIHPRLPSKKPRSQKCYLHF